MYTVFSNLTDINPMYLFSLEQFKQIFKRSIEDANNSSISNDLADEESFELMKKTFRIDLHDQVCKSLLDKHKILYDLAIAINIYSLKMTLNERAFHEDLLKFLMTGPTFLPYKFYQNPLPNNITERNWKLLLYASYHLNDLKEIAEHVIKNVNSWKDFLEDKTNEIPFKKEEDQLPKFAKILVFKILKDSYMVNQIKLFISEILGSEFLVKKVTNLKDIYKLSTPKRPILFILSSGNDPLSEISKLAEEQGKLPVPISLGRNMGNYATKVINEYRKRGYWIILQNCHLAQSWLPELEIIFDNLSLIEDKKELDPEFRCWLTSMPTSFFPQNLLMYCQKVTSEPPKGFKSVVQKQYYSLGTSKKDAVFFESNKRPKEWMNLLLALAYFHATVKERVAFGSIGWNYPYDFTDHDFRMSMLLIYNFLNEYDEIPFKALTYVISECIYGGRVTDEEDRKRIKGILGSIMNDNVIYSESRISSLNEYYVKAFSTKQQYIEFIDKLPEIDSPSLLGLNENSRVAISIETGQEIINLLIFTQPFMKTQQILDSSEGVKFQCESLKKLVPQKIRTELALKNLPISYEEGINSFIHQEIQKFNKLIDVINLSLNALIDCCSGVLPMTNEYEKLASEINRKVIPQMWKKVSFDYLKPLADWFRSLTERMKNIDEYIEKRFPKSHWISGFFYPEGLITGFII